MKIAHLFEHPEHLPEIARRIHEEWWAGKPGHTVETMAARLATASHRDAVPLSLVALIDESPVGTVNLVENDNDERPDLSPWLAALLVWPEQRGLGIGSQLVRALVAEAARLDIPRFYLGTDIPQYYIRLGAERYERGPGGYCIMCLRTGAGRAATERRE